MRQTSNVFAPDSTYVVAQPPAWILDRRQMSDLNNWHDRESRVEAAVGAERPPTRPSP